MTTATKPDYDEVQEAVKHLIYVTVNGAKLTVAPTRAAKVMQAFGKRVGNNSGYNHGWIPLNAKYQLHLGDRYSKDDVCKAAGMKVWDVAVPHDWHSRPENLKKFKEGEWAVWGYDGKDRTFGRPVWRTEVFKRMIPNILAKLKR